MAFSRTLETVLFFSDDRALLQRLMNLSADIVRRVPAGILGFSVAVVGGNNPDLRLSRALIVVGPTVLVLGWSILPLLAFGTDETLDPARLQLLPLARRPLMTGLLLASLVGYGPFAILLTMAGVVVGYGSGFGAIVTLLAVVLLVLLAAACSRTLATALAATLTSRRGRDLLIVVGAAVVIGVQLIRFVNFGNLDPEFWERTSNIARWFPPGALGQAIFDSQNGHLARALAELVPALIAVPLLLVVWGRALERSLTVVSDGSTRPRRAAGVARPSVSCSRSGSADRSGSRSRRDRCRRQRCCSPRSRGTSRSWVR